MNLKIGNITLPSCVVLGPMAGVTDLPFRIICRKLGNPLLVTEMISAKALFYGDKKTELFARVLEEESPVSLQLFGSDPEAIGYGVNFLKDSTAQFFDINMGCPAPKIVKNGDGSALMKNPSLAAKVVESAVKNSDRPVTVKFRKGWDDKSVNAVEFAKIIENAGASAITVHGRTREEFYSGKADWDIIRKVVEAVNIPVIGNGDIFSPQDAKRMMDETGCSGVMIARGAMGNPWILENVNRYLTTGELIEGPTIAQKLDIAKEHFNLLIKYKGSHIAVLEMRKHAAWYLKGIHGSAKIKNDLNQAKMPEEVIELLDSVYQTT